MSDLYRLKFKAPVFEVELESPNEAFIDEKLAQLIEQAKSANSIAVPTVVEQANTARTGETGHKVSDVKEIEHDMIAEEDEIVISTELEPERIADVVKNSDRYQLLKNKILLKSNQLNRILLALHYARATYGDKGFSTGFIEEITAALGSRIRKSNIAAQIKQNPSLFVSDREPGKGVTALYQLTKEGRQLYEQRLAKIQAKKK